ncbi:MAG: glycosyltransferase [Chloroflexi bacterium]|nr:glycosyltransferase [Chloroflexota bacterium]
MARINSNFSLVSWRSLRSCVRYFNRLIYKGTAYVAGFRQALRQGAEFIIQMDADFSHSPHYLPEFLRLGQEYEVVVGSRYIRGGQLDVRWEWGRWFLSWWANAIWTRLILGLKTKDSTAGFKCWQSSALEQIDLDTIRSNGYVFQVEMCYASERLGLRIKEVPIYFEDRRIGQSKMSIPIKLEAAWRVVEIRTRYSLARKVWRKLRPRTGPSNQSSVTSKRPAGLWRTLMGEIFNHRFHRFTQIFLFSASLRFLVLNGEI